VVAAWLREVQGTLGLVATVLAVLVFVALWIAVSSHLPHRPGPRRQLLPGALLFGVGLEGVHLFTAYYLVDRAERAQSTYGAIGTALVVLLWLYVVSRLIVGSAVLNAELSRHPRARGEPAGEEPGWSQDA
jgi:membrane protein